MHFTKMHGLGNDYLYVFGEVPDDISEICKKLSDRHFGAGSDGMIYISPSYAADFKMRIFNADGSEAMMCGNGIRCVGKYVYDKGFTDKTELDIETLSGIKHLALRVDHGKVTSVSVDMGCAKIGERLALDIENVTIEGLHVSVGNPHFVIFVDDVKKIPLETLGPAIEKHRAFPGGVNVEFVKPQGKNELRMRVWERGSGITFACGTGACAAASAAVSAGICGEGSPIKVTLDGGELEITVFSDLRVKMMGPAETVYEGDASI